MKQLVMFLAIVVALGLSGCGNESAGNLQPVKQAMPQPTFVVEVAADGNVSVVSSASGHVTVLDANPQNVEIGTTGHLFHESMLFVVKKVDGKVVIQGFRQGEGFINTYRQQKQK